MAVGRQPEIIRADSYQEVPWRNGGGVSRVIAGGDDDGWRLSVATIERDGWFSDYRGFDRTIVAIEGEGIELTVDGDVKRLQRRFEPFSFSGDAKTKCRLLGGPARDFNVVTQRDRWSHTVAISRVMGRRLQLTVAQLCFVYVLRGTVLEASTGDTIRIEGPDAIEIEHPNEDAYVCVVSLFPAPTARGH
ncbi:MAG TPA: HutD family protein [Candidatus Baltobacteraceae bacterium]|nr:HutD family protein [Candidatus Baltobacteraceae bacterium]